MFKGRTVKRAFERVGAGVHTGIVGRLEVRPGPPGSGMRFRSRSALGFADLPVHIDSVRTEAGSTILAGGGRVVRTPEHLLAALVAFQITDVLLVLEGPEVPILDGSALPWCSALNDVGVVETGEVRALDAPRLRIEANGGVAEAEPGPILRLEVDVSYEWGPRGSAAVEIPGLFVEEVAFARTFALERDVERLRAAGRGAGANLENTVVWGEDGPLNSVRSPQEPILHKLVDLAGDLALVGRPVTGTIRVRRGSHALHHALVRAIVAEAGRAAS